MFLIVDGSWDSWSPVRELLRDGCWGRQKIHFIHLFCWGKTSEPPLKTSALFCTSHFYSFWLRKRHFVQSFDRFFAQHLHKPTHLLEHPLCHTWRLWTSFEKRNQLEYSFLPRMRLIQSHFWNTCFPKVTTIHHPSISHLLTPLTNTYDKLTHDHINAHTHMPRKTMFHSDSLGSQIDTNAL